MTEAHPVAQFLRRLAPLPQDELDRFIAAGHERRLQAGEPFCTQGQPHHEIAFIRQGIVRYHVALPSGDEATKDFSFAGGFTVSFGSATRGVPAQVAISAVTPVELLVWPWQTMTALYESSALWQRVGRLAAEALYVRKEQRELSFLLQSASERYREMHQRFGAQLEQIAQHQLASYLGIRPQSLSRLKRRIADEPG
jgi:CRP-like cAMP-binding protein